MAAAPGKFELKHLDFEEGHQWVRNAVENDAKKLANSDAKHQFNHGNYENDYAGCYNVCNYKTTKKGIHDSWIVYHATHNTSKYELIEDLDFLNLSFDLLHPHTKKGMDDEYHRYTVNSHIKPE